MHRRVGREAAQGSRTSGAGAQEGGQTGGQCGAGGQVGREHRRVGRQVGSVGQEDRQGGSTGGWAERQRRAGRFKPSLGALFPQLPLNLAAGGRRPGRCLSPPAFHGRTEGLSPLDPLAQGLGGQQGAWGALRELRGSEPALNLEPAARSPGRSPLARTLSLLILVAGKQGGQAILPRTGLVLFQLRVQGEGSWGQAFPPHSPAPGLPHRIP